MTIADKKWGEGRPNRETYRAVRFAERACLVMEDPSVDVKEAVFEVITWGIDVLVL